MTEFPDPKLSVAKFWSPIVAIGPAAFFALLWRWLNADFHPFMPNGYNGPFACAAAGFWFWDWTYKGMRKYIADGDTKGFTNSTVNRTQRRLFVAAVAIPLGRILFTLIPPWDNGIGAILGMAFGEFAVPKAMSAKKTFFSHDRGTILLDLNEALRMISELAKGNEPRINWAGLDLPGEIAEGNILSVGAIGTGKTRLHRSLMASVFPTINPGSDRRVLIYDVKSDLLSELPLLNLVPNTEVLVMNPFDQRCVCWDIAADVTNTDKARHFADALILPAKNDQNSFFTKAARSIVTGVINSLNQTHPGKWNLRHLIRLTATRERLERVLAGTDLIEQFFFPLDTFGNILNSIANVMVELEPVAALWEHTTNKISLKQWILRGDTIMVLGGKEDLQSSLEPLNRVICKIIATAFASEPESPKKARLWFFCDELKSAGRLDALPLFLNARSKGVRCVLGFQDIPGLVGAFGDKDMVDEIIGRFHTITWLKLTDRGTAEWASKRAAELERFEYMTTRSKEGESLAESLTERDSIMPAQFLFLPDSADGLVSGFNVIKGIKGVFPSSAKFDFPKSGMKDFEPRPDSHLNLRLWSDDDDDWLDGGELDSPAAPEPDKPGPIPITRVDF